MARGRFALEGQAGDVYLVHPPPYDLFGLGPPFLAAARRLALRAPEAVRLDEHRDGRGELAYVAVTLRADHRIVLRRGVFRIELTGNAEPLSAAAGPGPRS
jgi:hypothetical protein